MPREHGEPQTFVEMVLVLLEDRFPWLKKDEEDKRRRHGAGPQRSSRRVGPQMRRAATELKSLL